MRMKEAFDTPKHPHTHCCFCGARNDDQPSGYAGERSCGICGNGGEGLGNIPNMAYMIQPNWSFGQKESR